jgi:hypothetical protein
MMAGKEPYFNQEYRNPPNYEKEDNALGPCDECGGWINNDQKFVRVKFKMNLNGAEVRDDEETDAVYHSDCYIRILDS